MYLSGPLVFGVFWLISPPESTGHGAAWATGIVISQVASLVLTSTIRRRFGLKYVLFIPPVLMVGSTYVVVLAFTWFDVIEYPRDAMHQIAIGFAIVYGAVVGALKYGEHKMLESFYRFISTGSIAAVLAFGTFRVLEEIIVRAPAHEDRTVYIAAMPVMLIALAELTRRELNRPD